MRGKRKKIMIAFQMPPLVQTEAQKAYCAAALAKAKAEAKARNAVVEKCLHTSLGGVMESRIQVGVDLFDNRIAKIAVFAQQHGLKVCVGRWSGLLFSPISDADKRLEQIILGFAYGIHVSQDEITDFEKAVKS